MNRSFRSACCQGVVLVAGACLVSAQGNAYSVVMTQPQQLSGPKVNSVKQTLKMDRSTDARQGGATCASTPVITTMPFHATGSGACCVDTLCVATNTSDECAALGGDWYAGQHCGTFSCPLVACPPGALLAQPPCSPNDSWALVTSEADTGSLDNNRNLIRYEHFVGLPGEVSAIHWWGAWLNFDGLAWSACAESTPEFEIRFYANDAGVPGVELCSCAANVPGIPTGVLYGGAYEMYYFEVDPLDPPCAVGGSYWVSIQGLGDDSCWFTWMSSGAGDGFSRFVVDGVAEYAEGFDLSLCLAVTTTDLTGACCNELTGECVDAVAAAACNGPHDRFVVDTVCADLDPSCGEQVGACRVDHAPGCIETTRGMCLYAPSDANCDGTVNFDDIDPFVAALVGPAVYYMSYPDGNHLNADVDGNGAVNFDDIDPFVNRLVVGGPPSPLPGEWLGWGTSCRGAGTLLHEPDSR